MSTINTVIQIQNQENGILFPLNLRRTTDSNGFATSEITVGAAEEAVSSDYTTPRHIALRLMSGDDVQVGTTMGGPYPFRLSGNDDYMILRLNLEAKREITTITCGADTAGSLDGDYVELRELGDTKVWPWFNMARKAVGTLTLSGNAVDAETVILGATTYTFKTVLTPAANEVLIGATASDSIDNLITAINAGAGSGTLYGTGTVANASATAATGSGDTMVVTAIAAGIAGNSIASTETMTNGSWGPATLTGGTASSTAPTVTTERLIQVDITEGATAAQVATALAAALDADSAYASAVASGNDVVVTDLHIGTRSPADDGTTGWAAPVETQAGAASHVVYLKSAGTSQVVVAVAPN